MALFALGASLETLHAQIAETKLLASDGDTLNWFGYSSSVSGETALVGAMYEHSNGDMGAVYVFGHVDGSWIEVQKLTPINPAAAPRFGVSVSLVDSVAYIGADDFAAGGSVFVFRLTEGAWRQEMELSVAESYGSFFGWTVAGSRDAVLIGSPPGLEPFETEGSAYVFRHVDGVWAVEQRLVPHDDDRALTYGYSVALFDDMAFVSALGDGAVYVFRKEGGLWTEQQKLFASDGEGLGSSISVSGDVLVVGANPGSNSNVPGSAYVFRYVEGLWIEEQKLTPSDGDGGDQFGRCVAVSGDLALIGAIGDDDGGSASGSVYIFRRVSGTWIEEMKLGASDGEEGDVFGGGVSLSGNIAFVGATGDDDNGSNSGSAYVFDGIPVGAEEPVLGIPSGASLKSASPNPARDRTTIGFTLPRPSHALLTVYDVLGRKVDVLFEGESSAGQHDVFLDVGDLTPGIYILRLETESGVTTQRLTVVR